MGAAEILALIVQGVEAAVSAAPQAIDIVDKGKALVTSLFTAGVISAEQQNVTHAHMDTTQAMALQGVFPLWWQVQPTPVAGPPPHAPAVVPEPGPTAANSPGQAPPPNIPPPVTNA